VSPQEVTFEKRGYVPGDPEAQAALERHAMTFVEGFNATLASVDVAALEEPLARIPADQRGFAYEGAGMALAALDLVTPGSRDRIGRLLRSHGAPYAYVIHVGAGWALARMKLRPRDRLDLDPALRWLVLDGYGAHETGFNTRRTVGRAAPPPRRLTGYERRVFDQGVGRTLWFNECADPDRIARTIGRFDQGRRGDLWSGAGTAATYTIVAAAHELERLRELSGEHAPHLAQGAAFAAMVRHDEGNLNAHTRMAAEVLCGRPAEDVVDQVLRARADLRPDPSGASYERWRTRVREALAAGATGAARPPTVSA
jgi:hypothetical protein